MAAGNNIPFDPKDSRYRKSNKAPVQNFSRKHSGAPGNPNSVKLAPQAENGRAYGKHSNEKAVIQRAAGKKLFGGKPGAFAQENYRDK